MVFSFLIIPVLLRGHNLGGKISFLSGAVVSGTVVRLAGDSNGSATTDASGNYSFTPASGSYTITPDIDSYYYRTVSSITVNISADCTTNDFTAEVYYNLSGTVSNINSGINTAVYISAAGLINRSTNIEQHALYSFRVPSGNYTVTPALDGSVFSPAVRYVSVSADTPDIGFLCMPAVYGVYGRLTDSLGSVYENVEVYINSINVSNKALTGTNGEYSFTVSAGTYTVRPVHSSYIFSPVYSNAFVVSAQPVSNINFMRKFSKDIKKDDIIAFLNNKIMRPDSTGLFSFSIHKNETGLSAAEIELVNLNGKIVEKLYGGSLNRGTHVFTVAQEKIDPGIYLLKIKMYREDKWFTYGYLVSVIY